MKSYKKSKLVLTLVVVAFLMCTNTVIFSSLLINNLLMNSLAPISISQPEDNYEENDSYTSAYDISSYERTWLDTIEGMGIQGDDDWYKIYVTSGYETIDIDVTFTHSEGDISLKIQNAANTWAYTVYSNFDNEYLDTTLPAYGFYYILIFGDNANNEYNLRWDDVKISSTDDNYEVNDAYTQAYNLSNNENAWLHTVSGYGTQYDEDWYEIYINPGYEHLTINCTFIDDEGDLAVDLCNSLGELIQTSNHSIGREQIDTIVSSSGTYYICVDGVGAGLDYNLRWRGQVYTPPGGGGGAIPGFSVCILISMLLSVSIISIIEIIKKKQL